MNQHDYDRLYDNPVAFALAIWEELGLNDKASPLTWIEQDMIRFGAHGPKRRGILAPRGAGKTTFIVCVLSLWRLFRDPDRRILVVSKSHTHAKNIISMAREWIDRVSFLTPLSPPPGRKDSATAFDVAGSTPDKQASMTAVGIDGQLEGNRAHTIYPDDVETDGNTVTLEARQALDNRVKEFIDILYPDKVDGRAAADPAEICYVGTYHHEDSLYIKLNQRGYRFQTWPLVYPQPNEKVLNLAPAIVEAHDKGRVKPGDNLFPHRFSETNLQEKRAEGYIRWAMQNALLCDLADSRRYPLRLRDLIVHEAPKAVAPISVEWGTRTGSGSTHREDITIDAIDPNERLYGPIFISDKTAPYSGTKAYIDPAGRGTDRTGVAIVAHLAGMLWVKAVAGYPGGSDNASLDRIATLLREHNARDIYLETNIDVFDTYQPSLEAALRRHFIRPGTDPSRPDGWSASVTPRRSFGAHKEARIVAALEPVMSTHRLIVDPSALVKAPGEEPHDSLQYQITRLTKERRCLREDGKIDALAGAVKEWAEVLAQSTTAAAARLSEDSTDQRVAYFKAAHARNQPQPAPRWFQHR